VHEIYSPDGPQLESGSPYTRHEIDLVPADASEQPVLGFVP
jgi:hypothetical protein